MTIAFISHPDCLNYQLGPGHPESPERLRAIDDQLLATGLDMALRRFDAPPATREQLERAHTPRHVEHVFQAGTGQGAEWVAPDTPVTAQALDAALRAAGAAILGVDLVMSDTTVSAFCNVRPPGHHAGRAHTMGLCLFNNVAVATAHAFAQHHLQRVAIVDFDVHHGNGTEDIVRGNAHVLFCSSYQHPFFPYSGTDSAASAANVIHVPLQEGSGSKEFRDGVASAFFGALDDFRPQLVMVSAGFDGHAEDDMADLLLHESDYAWITGEIKAIADRHAGGRIVSVLEGGYAPSALGRSVAAHLNALLG